MASPSPRNTAFGIGRQFAGKDRDLALAVECLAVDALAGQRHANDRFQFALVAEQATLLHLRLARGAHGGQGHDIDMRADIFRARDGPRREQAQDIFEPVVARVVQMIGLGRRKQDAVDLRTKQCGHEARAARAKRDEDFRQRGFEIAHGGWAGVQRRQRVDQNDLAIQPREMIAEEGLHHMRLVGLVAPLHHRGERAGAKFHAFVDAQRREGEGGRAFEFAGHEKAAGRQRGQRVIVRARSAQISGEEFGETLGFAFAFIGVGSNRQRRAAPVGGKRRARSGGACFQCFARPLRVGFGQQRQVEQPFAGIVDDVDGEFRWALPEAGAPLEFQRQAKLGNAARRFRPVPVVAAGQRGQMIFIGEARNVVVWLRLQFRAHQPALGMDTEDGQGALAILGGGGRTQQVFDQRRDEHCLARARQAGDAEAQARARHVVGERRRGDAGLEQKIGQDRHGGLRRAAPR